MEEASKPLSVESFSYSWLVSPNCSFRVSYDAYDDTSSFIEMDPNLTPSKRFLVRHDFDFDFDFPNSQSPTSLVDADKLISNGFLIPVGLSSGSAPVSPISSTTRFHKTRSLSLRRCNRLTKRIIQKYMDLVRPIWVKMRRGRSGSNRVQGVLENWECSSGVCWVDTSRRSCYSESSSSIHEAVVHCKKTIGMT